MVFALVACGNGGSDTPAPPASGGGGGGGGGGGNSPPFPNANPDGSINLDTVAHYDHNYDYTQNERFKFAYLAGDGGPLYQQSAVGYEHWAGMRNLEWQGFTSANGDTDLFMVQLQNLIDQGVQGMVVDPDTTIIPAVATLLSRHPDVKWGTHMAAARDGTTGAGVPVGGNMVNNYVGFDNYGAGYETAQKVLDWKIENFPDEPWSSFGLLALNFSVSPPLAEREMGARDIFLEVTGSLDHYFEADCVGIGLNMQGGMDASAPIISMNSQYKGWLVMGLIDDTSQGAAAIISQQGLEEMSCVATFGGSGLIRQWDGGQHDAFRYALYAGPLLYSEAVSGAVYAYLMGWTTPEEIWPSWIHPTDHGGAGKSFSQFRLPTTWMTPDNYKRYLAWCDIYAGGNAYPEYPRDGITASTYTPHAPIPKGFSGNP